MSFMGTNSHGIKSTGTKPVGIIVFPGTQCDQDTMKACQMSEVEARFIHYQDRFNYKDFSSLILPGGFSYGDYLRSGALAAHSASMESVREAAQNGWPVLGICNGFQILCESNLLPGTLTKNASLKFIDKWVYLKRVSDSSFWSDNQNKTFCFPIAHSEGRYFIDQEGLEEIKNNEQVWLEYQENPNGSVGDIAGVFNKNKNVAGLMPHPERAVEKWMGSDDGLSFFHSLQSSTNKITKEHTKEI